MVVNATLDSTAASEPKPNAPRVGVVWRLSMRRDINVTPILCDFVKPQERKGRVGYGGLTSSRKWRGSP